MAKLTDVRSPKYSQPTLLDLLSVISLRESVGGVSPSIGGDVGGVGNTVSIGSQGSTERGCVPPEGRQGTKRPAGLSDGIDWIPCRDGKARPIKSGLKPLVDGISFELADGRSRSDCSRAKILHGLGNAIVPQVAAEFIRAYMECE